MSALTLILVCVYAGGLLLLARQRGDSPGGVEYLLASRQLTLPAFVATLVTTWYGGILGVGEYAWTYGISTWLVFGVPYYLAAFVFALWLAPRLRRTRALSIPDLLRDSYGEGAAVTGAAAVFAATLPVAYVLMLATLLTQLTGLPVFLTTLVAAGFSALYVGLSGFRSVVRTDVLQLVLMYVCFIILFWASLARIGDLRDLLLALPPSHRAWDGGLGWQTVLVWYLIALQTVVEPTFYQRAFAARSPRTARNGTLIAIGFWVVFDFLSTFTGLAARVLLPELDNPVTAYSTLAELVLPEWLASLFFLGLLAIVMSTLDSYLFLAAATVGHDFDSGNVSAQAQRRRTRFGLAAAAALAALLALAFDSAVRVWHHVGSVVTSTLLLPVLVIHLPPRLRFSQPGAIAAMVLGATVSLGWIIAGSGGSYPLGVEPMFPALGASLGCWLVDLLRRGGSTQ